MSQVTVRSVVYQIDGQSYESRLAFDASQKNPLPGLLMAPNWMGVSAGAEEIQGLRGADRRPLRANRAPVEWR